MYQDKDDNTSNNHQIVLPLVDKSEDNVVFPLVLNVLTRFWGEEIPLDEIEKRSVNYKNYRGTLFIEGLDIIEKKLGLSYITYKGSIADIKKRINQGFPLIVILPGIGDIVQFATIICGYDSEEKRVLTYVYEPDSYGAIPEDRFVNEWSQDDYFSILIYPKDMENIIAKDDFTFKKSNRIYLEAERLKLLGKSNDALAQLNNALKIDKNENNEENPQVLCMMAGMLNELNDKTCIPIYEKVIKICPQFYLAYRGLGNFFLKEKNYELSKKYYLKAIGINPLRFGPIYKNLGIVYSNLGDDVSAKDSFKKYLEYVPNAIDKENILKFIDS